MLFFVLLFISFPFIPIERVVEKGHFPIIEEFPGRINSLGRWDTDSVFWSYSVAEVEPGAVITFKCSGLVQFAFLSSYNIPMKGEQPDFCLEGGKTAGRMSYCSGVHKIIVPKGCRYLYFSRKISGMDSTPKYLYINYDNILDGLYPIIEENVFMDIPFNKQQICVHHDSFCRSISDKKWHIGTNGSSAFPMNYVSPRKDYDFVDDGFRIKNGFLTNDTQVSVVEAFRLVERNLGANAILEIGLPQEHKSMERLVLNFLDNHNFESIRIRREEQMIRFEYIIRREGVELVKDICEKAVNGGEVRFILSKEGMVIFLNNRMIDFSDIRMNPNLKYGIMIDNKNKYQYDFFNSFLLAPYKIYEYNCDNDTRSQLRRKIIQGRVQGYSYSLDKRIRKSTRKAVERFELRRNTVTDYTNDRVERCLNYQLQTNLRKIKIEFDIMVPFNYENDSTSDCVMQIHDRVDSKELDGRSPYFAIRLQNLHFYLTAMSTEKQAKSGFTTNIRVPLGDCKLGEWRHFSIYVKEGYLAEHHPMTRIVLDNKLVYQSDKPNTNNNPRGGYIRYGIYKSSWLSQGKRNLIKSKILYFDNFKVII